MSFTIRSTTTGVSLFLTSSKSSVRAFFPRSSCSIRFGYDTHYSLHYLQFFTANTGSRYSQRK